MFRGGTVETSTVEPPWWPGYQLLPLNSGFLPAEVWGQVPGSTLTGVRISCPHWVGPVLRQNAGSRAEGMGAAASIEIDLCRITLALTGSSRACRNHLAMISVVIPHPSIHN